MNLDKLKQDYYMLLDEARNTFTVVKHKNNTYSAYWELYDEDTQESEKHSVDFNLDLTPSGLWQYGGCKEAPQPREVEKLWTSSQLEEFLETAFYSLENRVAFLRKLLKEYNGTWEDFQSY